MTQNLSLSTQATMLLSTYQKSAGVIDTNVEQQIQGAIVANQNQELSAEQLEQILIAAAPAQTDLIKQLRSSCLCHGGNAAFMTKILEHRIEKDNFVIHNQPHVVRTSRDPLYASFSMDPKASVMFLFNARDVDEKGRPLLMKVVAREGVDVSKLDLSAHRTSSSAPDVVTIPKNQDYVEIQDTHEQEFAFGDPLLQVSVDAAGKELSRSVNVNPANLLTTRPMMAMRDASGAVVPNPNSAADTPRTSSGAALDAQAVRSFGERIALSMKAKETFPEGGWLDISAAHVSAEMSVGRGYIFEPNSAASIQFVGTTLSTNVPAADAHLLGSAPTSAPIELSNANYSLRQLLQAGVTQTTNTVSGAQDRTSTNTPAAQLIYAQAQKIQIAARQLAPLGDVGLATAELPAAGIAAVKQPLAGDPEMDGQRICIDLAPGFIRAKEPASVDGWKVVVGYTDAAGKWQQAEAATVKGSSSDKQSFALDIGNAPEALRLNKQVEIRIFNDKGVPAERVIIPLRQINWAE